jgi:AcrR family transcriptional regulator
MSTTSDSRSRGRVRPTREETRERVLAAAFRVFGERGIRASSVSDVAAAAGLTKGAVYSSFASKDELVLAIMEQHVMERLSGALEAFASVPDLRAAMSEAGSNLVGALRADAAWHRLLAEYFALSAYDDVLHAALRDRRREARASIARALTKLAVDHRVTLPLPPDELALVLIALSNGLGIEAGIDPDGVPDEVFAKVLLLIGRGMFEEG